MILPNNGKIIILDDKELQAFPLIKILSKNKIPFTYHSDNKEFLPDSPYTDVRMIFLDINLTDSSDNVKNITSQLSAILKSLIAPKTAYILVIWSINEKDLYPEVIKLFENELSDIRPLVNTSLQKSDFFDFDPELGYIEKPNFDILGELQNRIIKALSSIDAVELLIKWENVVNLSSSEVITEIISLANRTQDMNGELKKIYYKLAEAMWGRQLKGLDDKTIALKASSILSHLLEDRLELNINEKIDCNLINQLKEPTTFETHDKSVFNSKLLLSFDKVKEVLPGNVYEFSGTTLNEYPFKGLIADSLLVPEAVKDFYILKTGKLPESTIEISKYKNEKRKDYESFEKDLRGKITGQSRFFFLEVSPICDYAQKKWKSNRVCPGVLWPYAFANYIGKSENLYTSPVIAIDADNYVMVLDLRYFTSFNHDVLSKMEPIFRLKHSFLIDIQSHLSRHINRPGITSLT